MSGVERDVNGYRLVALTCDSCGSDLVGPDGNNVDPGDCGHASCSHEGCSMEHLCYDCKRTDVAGSDFCPDHDPDDWEDSDGNPPTKEGLDRLRSIYYNRSQ